MSSSGSNSGSAAKPASRNTINHDDTALGKLLDELDAKITGNKNPRRQFVRWPFRVAAVQLTVHHPSGTPTSIHVACRNLSAGGLGVLHRSYVHQGTKVTVALPKVDGDLAEVEGTVVRCIHFRGTIHDVGIKFTAPVSARDFVKLDPFADGFSLEKVNPEDLKGSILYIEDSTLDQSLVRHFLRETQLRLQFATTKAEAFKKAGEGFDLILCDYNLGDNDDGAGIVKSLRDEGITTPIIMITADKSSTTRAKLIEAQANAFLPRPLQQNMLYRAIAEFMMTSSASGTLTSSLPPTHPNRGLLPTFVEQVRDYAKGLEKTIKEDNVLRCRSLCLQVAGAAPVMGFDKLAVLARDAEMAISAGMSINEAKVPLRKLINACLKVTHK